MGKRKTDLYSVQSQLDFSGNETQYIVVPNHHVTLSVKNMPSKNIKDPNRELMIKFKYNTATDEDTMMLHENVKKLIYKVMHSNCVRMEFEDVYQEVWKKIVKSKHSWNENMGTKVSTWIVCVANSVVNSLRTDVNKYNSRYCLYNDINYNNEEDLDLVDYNNNKRLYEESYIDNSMLNIILFSDDYKMFINTLNPDEKTILDIMLKINKTSTGTKTKRVSYNKICQTLDMKNSKLKRSMNSLKEKFRKCFSVYKVKVS